MDIPQSSLRKYVNRFREDLREGIANVVCNGEAFVNAADSPSVQIFLEVVSENVTNEVVGLINLIRDGKYEDNEELRRIRQHCIAIDKIDKIVRGWGVRLNTLDRHISKME